VATGLAIHPREAAALLASLLREGRIFHECKALRGFYRAP
jgi:hypothetical protein